MVTSGSARCDRGFLVFGDFFRSRVLRPAEGSPYGRRSEDRELRAVSRLRPGNNCISSGRIRNSGQCYYPGWAGCTREPGV